MQAMREANGSEPKRCAGVCKDGRACRAPALSGAGVYCFAHAPEQAEARAAARERGGRHSAKIVRLRALVPPRLVSVYDALEAALGEVHAGSLTPGQAGAMASLARAMVAVLTAGEIEERVRSLEQATARGIRAGQT